MARTNSQFNFTIPAELKDKLDKAAGENGITPNAELILRLKSTFEDDNAIHALSIRIERLEKELASLEDTQRNRLES